MSARSVNRFSRREVSRAIRAVTDAGAAIDRVEIDPKTGKIAVILAKLGGNAPSTNSWDEILTNAEDAKRTA